MVAAERPRSHHSGRNLSSQDDPHTQLPLIPTAADRFSQSTPPNKAEGPDIDRVISLAISECSSKEGNRHIGTEPATSAQSHNRGAVPLDGSAAVIPKARKRREIAVGWVPACLAVIMLALTALCAIGPDLWKSDFINSSSSNAIFVLRAVSEVTGFLLAITVASAFELLKWLLAVREGGIPLTEFLCLQEGTGILGLIRLTAEVKARAKTRLWSGLRLLAMVLLPILGVLIMSEVGTVLRFDKVGQTVALLGFGLGSLNTSVTVTLSPFTDIPLRASFSQFLDDPTHAVDTSDASRRRAYSITGDL